MPCLNREREREDGDEDDRGHDLGVLAGQTGDRRWVARSAGSGSSMHGRGHESGLKVTLKFGSGRTMVLSRDGLSFGCSLIL